MKNSKKVLSGVWAVLMLVSMLACFVLPATAEETQTNYYVGSASEWNDLAVEINKSDDGWAGKTIHIQNDISFSTKRTYNDTDYTECTIPTQITNFAGTLDGHGYTFSGINITTDATVELSKDWFNNIVEIKNKQIGTALIGNLTGTIQDLTLDSSCTFDAGSTASFGPFVLTTEGGTIQKCASYAICTSEADSAAVSGFVGKANDAEERLIIDGCIFGGTISGPIDTGSANAFIGTPVTGAPISINYSVAQGTFTAAKIGTDADHFENTYAVLASGSYDNADITKTDLNEAVWTINNKREQAESGEEVKVYLNVDENGIPCFGDKNNRTIRVIIENRTADESTEFEYYAPRKLDGTNTVQNRIAPGSKTGKVWEVSGAEHRGNYVYFGKNTDVTVTYHNTIATSDVTAMNGATFYTKYKIEQEKAELCSMVDAYEKMDSAYFGGYAFEVSKNAWIAKAKEVLAVGDFDALTQEEYDALGDDAKKTAAAIDEEKARIAELKALPARLQEIVEQEQNLEAYVVEMTDPEDYPSIQDYEIYKHVGSIKGYKIENAADWMKAVELSNFAETPNATNFSGLTLHLTKNIDMADYEGSKQMLPLCYSGYFDGYLDGHGYAFENVKMEIDSPLGPVGLIGVLGQNIAGAVQNVGIESGSIKVTGQPRLKQGLNVSGEGNLVGGLVGKNYVNYSLIRKCWNNADISVENASFVAGILGDGRKYAIIDSCINEGHTGYGGYGILGYGYYRAKTYNSMSGAVDKTAVGYHGAVTGIVADDANTTNVNEYNNSIIEENIETSMRGYISNVSGVKSIVNFSTTTGAVRTAQAAAEKNYNFKHSVMSSAAAGWTVNTNYVDTEYGDRVYYTLDKNGDVRFGAADGSDQIYRIKMICDHEEDCAKHPTRYAYGIAGRPITLGFDVQANYYACANENVTIKGNVLTFNKEAKAEENTFTVYVDYDADRGNVNGDNVINILDALDAVRMVVYQDTAVLKAADVNSNHKVDIRDAYQIIRYVLNGKNGNIAADFVAGEPAEKEGDYLKVASYNIKGAYYDPSSDSNSTGTALSRIDELLAELEAIDADIIGFQEVPNKASVSNYTSILDTLYTRLNTALGNKYKYKLYVPSRYYGETVTADGSNSAGDGIISKYPALDSKTVWFKGLPYPDDPTKHLDQSNNRSFTWFKIDVDENGEYEQGEDIIFYMCHLSTASDEQASAELQYILQYMTENFSGHRIVGVGDLNLGAYHTKAVLDKVNGSEVSYTALNGGDNYNTYTRTNPYSGSMVDNIMISDNLEYFRFSETRLSGSSGLNTRAQLYDANGNTVGTPYDGNAFTAEAWSASDHMPIWAYIKK